MFGIDILTAGSVILVASAAPLSCEIPRPAKINISPETKSVTYDTRRSLDDIQGAKVDTVNPYSFHDVTRTQGYMEGLVTMRPKVKIEYKFYPEYQAYCFWYDKIDVELEIEPKIVIAREVYEDKCTRKSVEEHEMKHVQADRRVVNKYAKTMGEKILAALQTRGFVVGPVPQSQGQATADRMQETVYQIVNHEYKKMQLERTEAQQAIDTLEEYERVSSLCAPKSAFIKKK